MQRDKRGEEHPSIFLANKIEAVLKFNWCVSAQKGAQNLGPNNKSARAHTHMWDWLGLARATHTTQFISAAACTFLGVVVVVAMLLLLDVSSTESISWLERRYISSKLILQVHTVGKNPLQKNAKFVRHCSKINGVVFCYFSDNNTISSFIFWDCYSTDGMILLFFTPSDLHWILLWFTGLFTEVYILNYLGVILKPCAPLRGMGVHEKST